MSNMAEVVDEIETETEIVVAPNGNGAGVVNQDTLEVESQAEGIEDEQPTNGSTESEDEGDDAGDGLDAGNGQQEAGEGERRQQQHLAPEVHVNMETDPGIATPNPLPAEDEQVVSDTPTSVAERASDSDDPEMRRCDMWLRDVNLIRNPDLKRIREMWRQNIQRGLPGPTGITEDDAGLYRDAKIKATVQGKDKALDVLKGAVQVKDKALDVLKDELIHRRQQIRDKPSPKVPKGNQTQKMDKEMKAMAKGMQDLLAMMEAQRARTTSGFDATHKELARYRKEINVMNREVAACQEACIKSTDSHIARGIAMREMQDELNRLSSEMAMRRERMDREEAERSARSIENGANGYEGIRVNGHPREHNISGMSYENRRRTSNSCDMSTEMPLGEPYADVDLMGMGYTSNDVKNIVQWPPDRVIAEARERGEDSRRIMWTHVTAKEVNKQLVPVEHGKDRTQEQLKDMMHTIAAHAVRDKNSGATIIRYLRSKLTGDLRTYLDSLSDNQDTDLRTLWYQIQYAGGKAITPTEANNQLREVMNNPVGLSVKQVGIKLVNLMRHKMGPNPNAQQKRYHMRDCVEKFNEFLITWIKNTTLMVDIQAIYNEVSKMIDENLSGNRNVDHQAYLTFTNRVCAIPQIAAIVFKAEKVQHRTSAIEYGGEAVAGAGEGLAGNGNHIVGSAGSYSTVVAQQGGAWKEPTGYTGQQYGNFQPRQPAQQAMPPQQVQQHHGNTGGMGNGNTSHPLNANGNGQGVGNANNNGGATTSGGGTDQNNQASWRTMSWKEKATHFPAGMKGSCWLCGGNEENHNWTNCKNYPPNTYPIDPRVNRACPKCYGYHPGQCRYDRGCINRGPPPAPTGTMGTGGPRAT